MKMTFRWYGEKDCIPLSYIKQIQGMTGVVTAVYDVPVGEVWDLEKLVRLKELAAAAGLETEVIESIPVHEDIKLGRPTRDKLIANYAQNIINCGKIGVKCVCYNFMPVFDWFRTNLRYENADGSNSLSYSEADFKKLDRNNLRLPGWDESYTQGELGALLAAYDGMTHERLFDNLVYFLNGIMPACREAGVNMAIHPDDPPWDIFALPRIVGREEDYDRLFAPFPTRITVLRSVPARSARASSTTFLKWRKSTRNVFISLIFANSNSRPIPIFTKTVTAPRTATWIFTR